MSIVTSEPQSGLTLRADQPPSPWPLALPLVFASGLVALAALPAARQNGNVLVAFLGAGAALIVWNILLLRRASRTGRRPSLEIVLRKQHYLQACT
jgi:hypothetical protein